MNASMVDTGCGFSLQVNMLIIRRRHYLMIRIWDIVINLIMQHNILLAYSVPEQYDDGDCKCNLLAADRLGPKIGSHGAVLHSLHEPGELSQCFNHEDSTIKIITVLLFFAPQYSILECKILITEQVTPRRRWWKCCGRRPHFPVGEPLTAAGIDKVLDRKSHFVLYVLILHCFRNTATYLSKIAHFHAALHWTPTMRITINPVGNTKPTGLSLSKLEWSLYQTVNKEFGQHNIQYGVLTAGVFDGRTDGHPATA